MNLTETFSKEVSTASPSDSIAVVVDKMHRDGVGAVVVIEEQKVVGIVTDRDIALRTVRDDVSKQSPVSEIMTRDVKTIWDDEGIFYATQYFLGHRVRRLPIIDRSDNLIGIVTADDLFALFSRELFNIAHALEPALRSDV